MIEDKRDGANFEPPCPLGQQLSGCLMGILLGYTACLLSDNNLYFTSVMVSIGTSFGSLASAVAQPWHISCREFLLFAFIGYVIDYLLLRFLFEITLVSLVYCAISTATIFFSLRTLFLITGISHVQKTTQRPCATV